MFTTANPRIRSRRRPCRRRPLQLESLEQRRLLAAFIWNTDADGNWHDEANWSGGSGVPGIGDDVTIDRGAANPIITVSGENARVSTIHATETIVIDGPELRIDDGGVFGSVQLVDGEFDVRGDSTLNGDLQWTGGVLRTEMMALAASGNHTISGADAKVFDGVVDRLGDVALAVVLRLADCLRVTGVGMVIG